MFYVCSNRQLKILPHGQFEPVSEPFADSAVLLLAGILWLTEGIQ